MYDTLVLMSTALKRLIHYNIECCEEENTAPNKLK